MDTISEYHAKRTNTLAYSVNWNVYKSKHNLGTVDVLRGLVDS